MNSKPSLASLQQSDVTNKSYMSGKKTPKLDFTRERKLLTGVASSVTPGCKDFNEGNYRSPMSQQLEQTQTRQRSYTTYNNADIEDKKLERQERSNSDHKPRSKDLSRTADAMFQKKQYANKNDKN